MTSSLVGSEMCIRDRLSSAHGRKMMFTMCAYAQDPCPEHRQAWELQTDCLLYTSDAADDM
eukprot:3906259-Prorocentrum_lima.AAC.1